MVPNYPLLSTTTIQKVLEFTVEDMTVQLEYLT